MGVRMRINRHATGSRRSHHKVEGVQLASCVDCGGSMVRHRACSHCGRYRGRVVVDMAAHAQKQEAKRKAKAEAVALERGEAAPQEEAQAEEKKA